MELGGDYIQLLESLHWDASGTQTKTGLLSDSVTNAGIPMTRFPLPGDNSLRNSGMGYTRDYYFIIKDTNDQLDERYTGQHLQGSQA